MWTGITRQDWQLHLKTLLRKAMNKIQEINYYKKDRIWTSWIQQCTTTASCANYTIQNDLIWTAWIQNHITLSSTTTASTNIIIANTDEIWTNWISKRPRKDPSAEDRERWRKQEEEARLLEVKRRQEEQEAKDRAEILLLRHLSPEQKEDLRTKGCFFVEVGGEIYRIDRGFAGNVKLLDRKGGDVRKSFCIHPKIRVPDADAMLAQKLLLEADKESFHKIANITDYARRTTPPPAPAPVVAPAPPAQQVA